MRAILIGGPADGWVFTLGGEGRDDLPAVLNAAIPAQRGDGHLIVVASIAPEGRAFTTAQYEINRVPGDQESNVVPYVYLPGALKPGQHAAEEPS